MSKIKVLDTTKVTAEKLEQLLNSGWTLQHALFPHAGKSMIILIHA